MAEEEGGISLDPQAVGGGVDGQPLSGVDLVRKELLSETVGKDLRPAPRHGDEAALFEPAQHSWEERPVFFRQVSDLHGGEGLELDAGARPGDGPKQIQVVREIQFRVAAFYQVHLMEIRDGTLGDPAGRLLRGHGVSVGGAERAVKGAKTAAVLADVRVVEMMVGDEEGPIPVPLFFHRQGELPEAAEIGGFEAAHAVFAPEPLPSRELPRDLAETWISQLVHEQTVYGNRRFRSRTHAVISVSSPWRMRERPGRRPRAKVAEKLFFIDVGEGCHVSRAGR
jgi:hypothetical protein